MLVGGKGASGGGKLTEDVGYEQYLATYEVSDSRLSPKLSP